LLMPRIRSRWSIVPGFKTVDGRPLNELGFDPILKMPELETFVEGVKKRKVCALMSWG
jgi:hypothetical protein